MVKSYGLGGVGGGPCDYSDSPSPLGLRDLGIRDWGQGLSIAD